MRINRLMLDYATPRQMLRPARETEGRLDGLLCCFKLTCYLAVATAIGSLISIVVAVVIDFLMR